MRVGFAYYPSAGSRSYTFMPLNKHSKSGRRRAAGDRDKVGKVPHRLSSIAFRPPPSGGGVVDVYSPQFVSAVPSRDYTISLTWWFVGVGEPAKYVFDRTNLTTLITESFEV